MSGSQAPNCRVERFAKEHTAISTHVKRRTPLSAILIEAPHLRPQLIGAAEAAGRAVDPVVAAAVVVAAILSTTAPES